MTIDELIERVRGQAGPDRETDALIEIEYRRQQAYKVGLNDEQRARWLVVGFKGEVEDGGTRYHSPEYTASLDAVVALVERVLPGRDQGSSFLGEDGGYAEVWERGYHDDTVIKAHAKTQAIALILALLSALKAKEALEDE